MCLKLARKFYIIFAFLLSPIFIMELFLSKPSFDIGAIVTWGYIIIGIILFKINPLKRIEEMVQSRIDKYINDSNCKFKIDAEIKGKDRNRYIGFDHNRRYFLFVDVLFTIDNAEVVDHFINYDDIINFEYDDQSRKLTVYTKNPDFSHFEVITRIGEWMDAKALMMQVANR